MNIQHIRTYLIVCAFAVVSLPLRGLHNRVQTHRKPAFNTLPRNEMGNTILTSRWAVGTFT